MTASQALAQALAGTGLSYRFSNATTVQIQQTQPQAAATDADGTITLDAVVLSSQGATTEGSGSYTTGETSVATRLP